VLFVRSVAIRTTSPQTAFRGTDEPELVDEQEARYGATARIAAAMSPLGNCPIFDGMGLSLGSRGHPLIFV